MRARSAIDDPQETFCREFVQERNHVVFALSSTYVEVASNRRTEVDHGYRLLQTLPKETRNGVEADVLTCREREGDISITEIRRDLSLVPPDDGSSGYRRHLGSILSVRRPMIRVPVAPSCGIVPTGNPSVG